MGRSECKLTVTDVVSIREMVGAGMAQGKIAGIFGVARSTVSAINSGRRWRGVRRFKIKKQVDMKLGQGGCGKCHGFVALDYVADIESVRGKFLMRQERLCVNCGARTATGETLRCMEEMGPLQFSAIILIILIVFLMWEA